MYLKYASIPWAIGAYAETGPLNGNVPPIVIDLFVTPGTASGLAAASVRANAPAAEMGQRSAKYRSASATFPYPLPPEMPGG